MMNERVFIGMYVELSNIRLLYEVIFGVFKDLCWRTGGNITTTPICELSVHVVMVKIFIVLKAYCIL